MDHPQLLAYLERLDAELHKETVLCVYGSAAFMLLGEEGRTSLAVDVAAPYSRADFTQLRQAAGKAGLPVNPEEQYAGDHLEWVGPIRLCLPPPQAQTEQVLWRGKQLEVKTVSPAELIASKLIRYDELDRSDVQFLWRQTRPALRDIEAAVARLPAPFCADAVVLANLENLKVDLEMWSQRTP